MMVVLVVVLVAVTMDEYDDQGETGKKKTRMHTLIPCGFGFLIMNT